MSRAFTSEEYESREVEVVVPEKEEHSADAEIVFAYSKGRRFDDPSLPYEIGLHFLNGDEGFFRSDEFAEKWLKRSVKMNHAKAMLALADFYLKDTKTHGFRKPAKLIRMAADLDDPEAIDILDMENIDSPTSKKTYDAYRFNAELGSVEAMMKLAEGFEKGHFGKDKFRAAVIWYTKAYRNGCEEASKKALALHYKKKIVLSDEELASLRR